MTDLAKVYAVIRQNLIDHSEHVGRIVGGAACEQWFSAEAFAAVNWPAEGLLAPPRYALAEYRKRDLVVWSDVEKVTAFIESKVVHNNKNMRPKLLELQGQLARPNFDDEKDDCGRAGLVYVVWHNYLTRREFAREAAYHDTVTSEVDRLFPAEQYQRIPREGLDEIVPETGLKCPDGDYRVSLATKFFQKLA